MLATVRVCACRCKTIKFRNGYKSPPGAGGGSMAQRANDARQNNPGTQNKEHPSCDYRPHREARSKPGLRFALLRQPIFLRRRAHLARGDSVDAMEGACKIMGVDETVFGGHISAMVLDACADREERGVPDPAVVSEYRTKRPLFERGRSACVTTFRTPWQSGRRHAWISAHQQSTYRQIFQAARSRTAFVKSSSRHAIQGSRDECDRRLNQSRGPFSLSNGRAWRRVSMCLRASPPSADALRALHILLPSGGSTTAPAEDEGRRELYWKNHLQIPHGPAPCHERSDLPARRLLPLDHPDVSNARLGKTALENGRSHLHRCDSSSGSASAPH